MITHSHLNELRLSDLALLIELSETHSLREVARRHSMNPSQLSKAIKRIEAKTGTVLLTRTSQKMIFTLEGMNFLKVLPLYVVFFTITPFILKLFERGRGSYVIWISFSLWILGQMHPQKALLIFLINKWPTLPWNLGSFEILSWQMLFILSLFLGFQVSHGRFIFKPSQKVFWLCSTLGIFFFVHKIFSGHGVVSFTPEWTDTSALGPLRLLNVFSLAYVLSYLAARYGGIFKQKQIMSLGQNSLYVFSFHLVLVYVLALGKDTFSHWPLEISLSVLGLSVLSIYFPAFLRMKDLRQLKTI